MLRVEGELTYAAALPLIPPAWKMMAYTYGITQPVSDRGSRISTRDHRGFGACEIARALILRCGDDYGDNVAHGVTECP